MSNGDFRSLQRRAISYITVGRLKRTFRGLPGEVVNWLRIVCRAIFVERLVLTSLFLAIAWPALLLVYLQGRFFDTWKRAKISPFIYTMQ